MLNCAPIHEAIRPAVRRTACSAFPLSGRGWSLLCALLGAALALSAQTLRVSLKKPVVFAKSDVNLPH